MRVFVALDIPEEIRARLAAVSQQLRPHCPDGRWVRSESMHLTLKFIGEVDEAKVEGIRNALGAVKVSGALKFAFRGVWFFPDERFPRVVAAYVHPLEGCFNPAKLVEKIEWHLGPLGIAREKRSFFAHLTLARIEPRRKHPELREAMQVVMRSEFGAMETGEFHLYQSMLKRGGAEYTKLATFSFVEPK